MNLAHPPGHIFWKTEAKVDRLSLYLDRVLSGEVGDKGGSRASLHTNTQSATGSTHQPNIQVMVEKLYSRLFSNDLMFSRVFELPPKNLCSQDGLHFKQLSEKEYECRLFLRRFTDQNCCQVVYGAQHDIPPGMAVHRLNPCLTNEQKVFIKEEWGPCMDEEGYMSPAKMYPWFAMGMVNTMQSIMDERDEDGRATDHLFEDVVVAGEYPVVKIIIPPKKEDPNNMDYNASNTNISSLLDSSQSISGSLRSEDTQQQAENVVKQSNQNHSTACDDKSRTKAQWYPRGKGIVEEPQVTKPDRQSPMVTPRSSVMSGFSSKTFSSFSRAVETIQEQINEEPYVIILKPAIKGYGLPAGVKLQHALPKQKPYCDIGKECIISLQDKLEDGQSLWYLEAATLRLTRNVENSARFKSMMRKIGRESKFWNICFTPITNIIQQNMTKACKGSEFPVELDKVKKCINIMQVNHGWHCLNDDLVDIALMNVVKSYMLTVRSLGQVTIKTLKFLQNIAENQSCADFLQPNVNIAQGINKDEGKWVAAEIKQVIEEIEKDPGYVLSYIGYQKRND